MKTKTGFLALLFLALLLAAVPARAQQPSVDDYLGRLPENTLLYLRWKNLDDIESLRAANPLLRFLDSPEMKANFQAIEEFQRRAQEARKRRRTAQQAEQQPTEPRPRKQPSGEEIFQHLTRLAANPGLLAVVLVPPAEAKAQPDGALLYLYDLTGQEELLQELHALYGGPERQEHTYDLDGIPVVETLDAKGKPQAYQARLNNWLVGGSDKALTETWIRAVQQAPERSLKDASAFRRARAHAKPQAQLEVFFNGPAWLQLIAHSKPRPPAQVSPEELARVLGLDNWEGALLAAAFEPERTWYSFAGFGRDSELSLVDLIPHSESDFAALDFAPVDTYSFSATRLDPLVLWRFLQRALDAFVPRQQRAVVDAVRQSFEQQLGVTLDELFTALGTEYAAFDYPAPDGRRAESLYVSRLRDRAPVLTLLRTGLPLFGAQLGIAGLTNERMEEGVVYFSFPGPKQAAAGGLPRRRFYHVAVSEEWAVAGSSRTEVKRALARLETGPSLRTSARFRQARTRFPSELSGFSYWEVERWMETEQARELLDTFAQGLVESVRTAERQAKEAEKKASSPASEEGEPGEQQPSEPEKPLAPPKLVLPRGYLNWVLSATWRDARGLFHLGYIE